MAKSTLNEDELKADAKEYLRWRSKRIGSSDVPVILGESPFKTPHGLWLEKTGRVDSSFFTNLAIELGKKFEDTVRTGLEMRLDIDFPPTIMTDDLYPFMSSSLDGYNEEHDIVLEIKCVQGGPTWEKAVQGIASDAYVAQLQHQLYVTKAKVNYFYVAKLDKVVDHRGYPTGKYFIAGTRLVEVYPDAVEQERIVKACLEFYKMMTSDVPPALCNRDVMSVVDDLEALALLTDKKELIKYMVEKYNHTNFNIAGNKLMRDVNEVWRLTLNKG